MNDVASVDQGRVQNGGDGAASASITRVAAETARTVQEEFAGVVEDVRHQASDQFEQHRETATKAMTDFAAAIRKAAEELTQHDQSLGAKMIKQAADGLERVSRSLSDKQPEELLDAARNFSRDNPVAFGAAAVLAGLAVGRFLRSSEGHGPASSSQAPSSRESATQPSAPSNEAKFAEPIGDIRPTLTEASKRTAPVQVGAAAKQQADAADSSTAWRA